MLDHVSAKPVVEAAWRKVHGRDPTPLETLYTQAIASLETGYGQIGQFAKYAAAGQYNWGGIQNAGKLIGGDSCPDGWVYGVDQHPTCFKVFPTQEDAAAYFVRTLTAGRWPGVVAAMAGSPEDVARAMRTPPPAYYGGVSGSEDDKVAAYAKAIQNSIDAIGRNAPIPHVPSSNGGGGGSSKLGLLTVAAIGGWAAWRWYSGAPFLPSFLGRLL